LSIENAEFSITVQSGVNGDEIFGETGNMRATRELRFSVGMSLAECLCPHMTKKFAQYDNK
tara:strand:- start:1622 stop:1804 length:183 start_codon:yes stop_codon:yes gene_type:complete